MTSRIEALRSALNPSRCGDSLRTLLGLILAMALSAPMQPATAAGAEFDELTHGYDVKLSTSAAVAVPAVDLRQALAERAGNGYDSPVFSVPQRG